MKEFGQFKNVYNLLQNSKLIYKIFVMFTSANSSTCNKGPTHQGKQLMMICLNNQCQAKRLCCVSCIDDFHKKHQLISLLKFQKMLQILARKLEPEVKANILGRFEAYEQQLCRYFDKMVESFIANIQRSKQKVKQCFRNTYKSINYCLQDQDKHNFIQELTDQKVCSYLKLVREAENQNFRNVQSAQKMLSLMKANFDKQVSQNQKQFDKGFLQIDKNIQKLNQFFTTISYKRRNFSNTLKSSALSLNPTLDIVKRFQGAGGYPIVLFQDKLTQINDSVKVVIKQQPGSKNIWMGVCILDIVKANNYTHCYGIGKGAWAIDQVGANHQSAYSWSHHDLTYNSQPKGFQIMVGDIITIRVDFNKKIVIFSKGELKFQQPIRTDIGDIYAFVGPTNLGDTIAIL